MRRLLASALTFALVLGACGGDDASRPNPSAEAGTYTLLTYNGAALPALSVAQTGQVEIIAGRMTIADPTRYNLQLSLRTVGSSVIDYLRQSGTWNVTDRGEVALWPQGEDSYVGIRTGNRLTIQVGGETFVYER